MFGWRRRKAEKTLAVALEALRWARQYREDSQRDANVSDTSEIWKWYCQGSLVAAEHDYACVEESLRRYLGLLPPFYDLIQEIDSDQDRFDLTDGDLRGLMQ